MAITMRRKKPQGIILLVVLTMLTFFSLLVAAYLVFSTEARIASAAISARNIKQPDPNMWLDEAMMTLVRGTADSRNPFFGEDLLSDYYGRRDATSVTTTAVGTAILTGGGAGTSFVSIPVASPGYDYDDAFAGRVITFQSGVLLNKSFRVISSQLTSAGNHDFIIELLPPYTAADVAVSDSIWVNGIPRNAVGIGFGTTAISETPATTSTQQTANLQSGGPVAGFPSLPVALQPNHLGRTIQKSGLLSEGSDFDEDYDAADYNNWFLSYRQPDGTIIPSFHRPSVTNYILNAFDWTTIPTMPDAAALTSVRNVMTSLARSTFRPLPFAANQLGASSPAISPGFTGGNPAFGLRVPFNATPTRPLNSTQLRARVDQMAKSLISGDPDVDTDGDGQKDSYWVDLRLPIFTAPDGKLLKAMIAPQIEDLSGRLNVNTLGNFAMVGESNATAFDTAANTTTPVRWAGAPAVGFSVSRGLGFGPAEIGIEAPSADDFSGLLQARYLRDRNRLTSEFTPGLFGADALSTLRDGWRPRFLNANAGYGRSVDPYGIGGTGITEFGSLRSFNSGRAVTDNTTATTTITEPTTNEAVGSPYESDPTSRLGGDSLFTAAEFETILRSNEFDVDMLPDRLRNALQPFVTASSDMNRHVTVRSRTDDSSLSGTIDNESAYGELISALEDASGTALTAIQRKRLVAPEIRLARKMDVNRRFGNGNDDNGNDVIDDPQEINLPLVDDDGDGAIDEADEVTGSETLAFMSHAGATVDSRFSAASPTYNFDEANLVTATIVPAGPRELYARHLYVLMMLISNDLNNTYPSFGDTLPTAVPVSDREAYRARRLAQWAVNVVDYRDPDSIMTRFRYDPNPFDGWNIAVGDTVWGCEAPELLLSESLATHDTRIRDTDLDTEGAKGSGGTDTDDDCDQVRIPQGSLVFELFCGREEVIAASSSPLVAGIPRELYDVNTGGTNVTYGLDLDRTVTTHFGDQGDADPTNDIYGDASDPSFEVPVWRIAISEPHFEGAELDNSPLEARALYPDTLSFEPQDLDEIDAGTRRLQLERFVFFNHFASRAQLQQVIRPIPDIIDSERVFFSYDSAATRSLGPERYLTLAPRTNTYFGSRKFASNTNPTRHSGQGLLLETAANADGLMHYESTGATTSTRVTPDTSTAIQASRGLVIAGFPSTAWTDAAVTAPNGIGLNVSEPLATTYYAEPDERYTTVAGTFFPSTDAYIEFDSVGQGVGGAPLDQPEDMRLNGPINELTNHFAAGADDPMLGTVENYRTAFLQRLADPTRGYHPRRNPYLTVDQIALDLTIFSGEETSTNVTTVGSGGTATVERNYQSGSRQRSGVPNNGVGANVLYSYTTEVPAAVGLNSGSPTEYFALTGVSGLDATFSYLNKGFGTPTALTTATRGRPSIPFAMHPWLNRPFATPYELMMVPASSPARLFEEFTVVAAGANPAIIPPAAATPVDVAYARTFVAPYRHLINFFSSGAGGTATQDSADFANLFAYLATPGPYRGEMPAITPASVTGTELEPLFAAPFNFTDDSQRSGRVNLNTVSGFPVWKGLMQGHMTSAEYTTSGSTSQLGFQSFQDSRRGYSTSTPGAVVRVSDATANHTVNYDPQHIDVRYPTQFAGMFRSPLRSKFAPLIRNNASAPGNESNDLRRRGVNGSLFRGEGTLADQEGGTPNSVSMFVRDSTTAANAYANRDRNAFMRYQTLMRMPNVATDNSQVFSIRLTLGFFEVDASDANSVGREYRADSGQSQRYKALFIVDRSIPVGFIPGRDTNVRDAVIFERFYQ